MQGLRELWRDQKKERKNKGESGGQEAGSTILPSLDLWDRRMSGCRVYNYLEQPYDIFLRIPSNGVEGRWLVETMLIVRTGDA